MSQVSVCALEADTPSSQSALATLNGISTAIRNRAYDLFEQRGGSPGGDVNDWLQAERDLFTIPPCELSESSREYTLQISLPGVDSNNVEVSSTGNGVIVMASNQRSGSSGSSSVRFSEMSSKSIFRMLELPSSINSSKVTARMDNGMLTITAPKSSGSGRSTAASA